VKRLTEPDSVPLVDDYLEAVALGGYPERVVLGRAGAKKHSALHLLGISAGELKQPAEIDLP
jgi:hypothetical protein